jgi:hypothetical protein
MVRAAFSRTAARNLSLSTKQTRKGLLLLGILLVGAQSRRLCRRGRSRPQWRLLPPGGTLFQTRPSQNIELVRRVFVGQPFQQCRRTVQVERSAVATLVAGSRRRPVERVRASFRVPHTVVSKTRRERRCCSKIIVRWRSEAIRNVVPV